MELQHGLRVDLYWRRVRGEGAGRATGARAGRCPGAGMMKEMTGDRAHGSAGGGTDACSLRGSRSLRRSIHFFGGAGDVEQFAMGRQPYQGKLHS